MAASDCVMPEIFQKRRQTTWSVLERKAGDDDCLTHVPSLFLKSQWFDLQWPDWEMRLANHVAPVEFISNSLTGVIATTIQFKNF